MSNCDRQMYLFHFLADVFGEALDVNDWFVEGGPARYQEGLVRFNALLRELHPELQPISMWPDTIGNVQIYLASPGGRAGRKSLDSMETYHAILLTGLKMLGWERIDMTALNLRDRMHPHYSDHAWQALAKKLYEVR